MFDDAPFHVGINRLVREAEHELGNLWWFERRELDDEAGRCRTSPSRSVLEELRPSRAEHEHRSLRPLAEVLDQVEQRRLRPMDVLEDRDDGVRAGQRLEQSSYGPEALGRGRGAVGDADGERDLLGGASAFSSAARSSTSPARTSSPAAWRTISASGQNVMPSP